MEEFNKNIDGIRRMMSELKGEKYAIVNPDLVAFDEYMKTLYLKTLCTLVQFGGEPTEMQVLYLKRIVNGIGVDEPMEEYMRRALEISDKDMQEFLNVMKENKAKYYFALDGLLLVSIGMKNQECYQYLAEIIELLDICKDDLGYVCLVASSVLQQQSSFYDDAKGLINERLREIDYTPYLQDFYCGAIKDCKEIVHYLAIDKKYSDDIELRTSYTERRVIFENLNISVKETWNFNGCDEVCFKNCNFTGSDFSIKINNCEKVFIFKCRFEDFSAPVFWQEKNIEVIIEECEFENCINKVFFHVAYQYSLFPMNKKVGSIIYTDQTEKNGLNNIRKTKFRNCGGLSEGINEIEGIISNCRCKVNDCSFNRCNLYRENGVNDGGHATLFLRGTVKKNNELIQSTNFSFDE